MSTKKPAIVRRLEGNPGRRPIEEVGIEAQGTPFIPEHLPDDARGVIEVIQIDAAFRLLCPARI